MGAFAGRFQKAVFIDSTDIAYNRVTPKYKTNGFVIKAGLKTRKNAFLLTYASAYDDKSSISYYNPKFKIKPRREAQILMGRSRITIGAAMLTATIRIQARLEGQIRT